ncbi:unnamed protein product [Leuciscus chuanchicus]
MSSEAGVSLFDVEDVDSPECSACVWREQSKVLRLETIKSQILSKLRLKQAPNISREVVNQLLPKAPPLQQLLDHHDFQGDASSLDDFLDTDEYHATTESVITMASEPHVPAGTMNTLDIQGTNHINDHLTAAELIDASYK